MTVEELQVMITANTQGVRNEVNNARASMRSLSEQAEASSSGLKRGFESAGKAIVSAGKTIAIGIGAGAVALAGMAIKASEYCASIDDVAQRTNLSAKTVQEFKFAAEQSGIGMEAIEGSAKKLTIAMGKVGEGNKEAIENFSKLGVATKDANGNLLSTDQVMPNVINKLADMSNITERNALGVQLFGKGFMDMAPMLNDGSKGVQAFKDEANKLGLVLGDDAISAGAKFDDTMAKVKSSLSMVGTVVGNKVMPIIQKMMDWTMANMPQIQAVTSKVFGAIGDAIGIVTDVFKNKLIPTFKALWEWIQPYMPQIKEAISDAFDKIKVAVGVAVDIFDKLMEGLKVVGKWAMEHKELLINIGLVIGAFALSFELVTGAIALWTTVTTIATAVTTAFGTAMAFLTSPVGLVVLAIGAIIAIGVLLYKNWDWIKEQADKIFSGIWEGIKAVFSVVKDVLLGFFTLAWEAIKAYVGLWVAFFKFIWDGIKLIFSVVKDVLLGFFTLAWNAIKAYVGLWVAVFQGIWNGIAKVFSVVKDVLLGFFSSAWEAIKGVFSGVGAFFDGIWTTIKNTFTTIGSVIGDAIGGAFKVVVNSIIGFAENTINGFINAINAAIGMINKIPGVDIGMIGTFNIPKLARGGIVDSAQMFIAGENGKEAVMPLENNTGWITQLADKVSSRMPNGSGKGITQTVNIYSPSALSPSETARQNKRALQELAFNF